MRCVWLDSSTVKACRVLRARLLPLGWVVVCRFDLPDPFIEELASRMGCVIVTTDKRLAAKTGGIYIDPQTVKRKSARDLATLITKLVSRKTGPMSPDLP